MVVLVAIALLWPASVIAQDDCFPGAASNEAKTLAIFAVPLAFGRGSAPEVYPGFKAGLELTYIPRVSDATATPTICRPGKGAENTDLLIALPRPRIGMPLPLGLSLQASWVPPVRVNGVKANLFGISLEKVFGQVDGIVAAVRAHATFGSVRAPITCSDEELDDPTTECFGGTRSDDRLSPNIRGVDVAIGGSLAGGQLRPYAGAGYNRLQPRFQVNFIDQGGVLDDRRVQVDLDRFVVFGGATWQVGTRLGITGEVYAAPADAVTGRVIVRTAVGP
jgi:hypothetical protein